MESLIILSVVRDVRKWGSDTVNMPADSYENFEEQVGTL